MKKSILLTLLIGYIYSYAQNSHNYGNTPNNVEDSKRKLLAINLYKARKVAIANNPTVTISKLLVEKAKKARKTAFDLGNTRFYFGQEDIRNNGSGTANIIGLSQGNIDIFGSIAKSKLYNEQLSLAQNNVELTNAHVIKEVSNAWADAYVLKKIYDIYLKISNSFADIERAAKISYDTKSTSRLEYLSILNKATSLKFLKEQSFREYRGALYNLNLWLSKKDIFYNVTDVLPKDLQLRLDLSNLKADINHPFLRLSEQEVEVAKANAITKKSAYLPTFSAEVVRKKENGSKLGFYEYSIGIQIPIFSSSSLANAQSAKIDYEIAQENLYKNKLEFETNFNNSKEEFLKWKNSWNYYKNEILPMSAEQRTNALLSFKEGSIDYITFIGNVSSATELEVNVWNTYNNYLKSFFTLEYYLMELKNIKK